MDSVKQNFVLPQHFNRIEARIKLQYYNALEMYCCFANLAVAPLFLSAPYSYFYTKKKKEGIKNRIEVFLVFPVPYTDPRTNKQKNIRRITEESYKRLFLLHGLPINDGLISELYQAMKALIENHSGLQSVEILNRIKRHNLSAAKFLAEYVTIDRKNVYMRSLGSAFSLYKNYPMLCLSKEQFPPNVPLTLLNRYLSARIREWKSDYSTDIPPAEKTLSRYILYYDRSFNHFVKLLLETKDEDRHCVAISLQNALDYPEKTVKTSIVQPVLSSSIKEILYALTGGKTELLDRLAVLFADAASVNLPSKKKKAAIICSRVNGDRIALLISTVLDGSIINKVERIEGAIKSLKSASRYCSQPGLRRLFCEQGNGRGVVIVNDTLLSDASLPVFKKMICGEKVSFKSLNFPMQHLYNDTFFVFISDDPNNAKKLREQIHCELIDLTNDELEPSEHLEVKESDRVWLQKVFLPYGLTVDKQKETPPKPSHYSDSVEEFIKTQCKKGRNEKCTRKELYDSFTSYYQWKHTDNKPKLTIGRFVKAVNDLIKNDPQISYKKLRSTQSRYFIGISCQTDFSTFPKPNLPNTGSFLEYLEQINKTYSHLLDQKPTASESKSGLIVEYRRTSDSEVKQEKSP